MLCRVMKSTLLYWSLRHRTKKARRLLFQNRRALQTIREHCRAEDKGTALTRIAGVANCNMAIEEAIAARGHALRNEVSMLRDLNKELRRLFAMIETGLDYARVREMLGVDRAARGFDALFSQPGDWRSSGES